MAKVHSTRQSLTYFGSRFVHVFCSHLFTFEFIALQAPWMEANNLLDNFCGTSERKSENFKFF